MVREQVLEAFIASLLRTVPGHAVSAAAAAAAGFAQPASLGLDYARGDEQIARAAQRVAADLRQIEQHVDEPGAAGQRLTEAVKALAATDNQYDGSVVTAYALTVEFIHPTGRRTLGYVTRDGSGARELATWTTLGLLAAARLHYEAQIVASDLGVNDGTGS